VAQACNPSYLGGRDGEDCGSRPAQTNVQKTPSQPMAGYSGGHLSPQATWGNMNRRIEVQAALEINWDPISKTTNAKRAGGLAQVVRGLAQVVKCLPSKWGPWVAHPVLPFPAKKKKVPAVGSRAAMSIANTPWEMCVNLHFLWSP
jgi:hypothetical protein